MSARLIATIFNNAQFDADIPLWQKLL